MKEKIEGLLSELENYPVDNKDQLERFRINFIGQKNKIKALFSELKSLSPDEKKAVGQQINALKNNAEERYNTLKAQFEQEKSTSDQNFIDLSRSAEPIELGARHPISLVKNEIVDIFKRIGFTISEGPEIEDDWHNFSALNLPEEHPARDMQDTFFISKDPDYMLRTHTSSVQVRYMENNQPPIRIISPGRVFRNEAISARSHCIFHQVEGLYIDKGVSFADLRQTLLYFSREFFGENTKIRLRPSYFPFTEPSAELDVSCFICNQEGCRVCKYTGWVEIMGCGMVDPNVLDNCGIDSSKYTGYAFGMGIERPAMLKYQVDDIRLFFENDIRFLEQFKSVF